MSDRSRTHQKALPLTDVGILLYSDDRNTRESVRFAVGPRVGDRDIRWTEVATHAAVVSEAEKGGLDLLILDGEAAKSGGMGICKQLKNELRRCPPVLLIVGRRDDAWLATWSEADGAISHPIDPFEMKVAVDDLLSDGAIYHPANPFETKASADDVSVPLEDSTK